MLGHADVRTTLQVYVHSSLEHKMRVIQSICFLAPALTTEVTPSPSPSVFSGNAPIPTAFGGSIANGINLRNSQTLFILASLLQIHYTVSCVIVNSFAVLLLLKMVPPGRVTPFFSRLRAQNTVAHDFILSHRIAVHPAKVSGITLDGVDDSVLHLLDDTHMVRLPVLGPEPPVLSQSKKMIIPGAGSSEPSIHCPRS